MLSFRIYTVATCILSARITFHYIIYNITHWEDLAGIPIPTMPMNFAVLGSGCSTQSPIRNPSLNTLISSCWKYQASFRLLVPMSAMSSTDPQCRVRFIAPTQVPMQSSLCPEALHILVKVVVAKRVPPRVLWTSRCAKKYSNLAHIELATTPLITV